MDEPTVEQRALIAKIINEAVNQEINIRIVAAASRIHYPNELGNLSCAQIENEMFSTLING